MKKLIPILTIFLSFFLFPSTSLGEWKPVSKSIDGKDVFFLDFDRIRESGDYVYYWSLGNFPESDGTLSVMIYQKGDCERFTHKIIDVYGFEGQMGQGEETGHDNSESKWRSPPPNSSLEIMLKSVCERSN